LGPSRAAGVNELNRCHADAIRQQARIEKVMAEVEAAFDHLKKQATKRTR
jgi:hypothetical protein